ncbi:MAG: hypothetical protein HWD58_13320 [Bacteroidota bacterium]|nr:MAG: hypothetical protein HWD58_13320 [Bacteroidota bacterium]
MSPPFACYGFSQAVGGPNDTSDIGAFIIGDVSNNTNIYAFITGGPHLLNPASVKNVPIIPVQELWNLSQIVCIKFPSIIS